MKQLNPKVIWLFFIQFIARGFFLGIMFSMIFGHVTLLYLARGGQVAAGIKFIVSFYLILLVVVLILAYLWARLTYRYYRYELGESAFRKESGVIWKKYTSIPYERIQNVDIYRGLLARILGLSDLNIQTAGASAVVGRYGGGMGAEGRLPGVSKEEAEKLRDELLNRAGRRSSQG